MNQEGRIFFFFFYILAVYYIAFSLIAELITWAYFQKHFKLIQLFTCKSDCIQQMELAVVAAFSLNFKILEKNKKKKKNSETHPQTPTRSKLFTITASP